MINHLIKLADYLDSRGKINYASQIDYAISKVSQIEELSTSRDAKIEETIKVLSEALVDADHPNIYSFRNEVYGLLKNHSNPASLLGRGWSIQSENQSHTGDLVLLNPEGKVMGDEGPDDPIFNVAMYFAFLAEDELYRKQEFERAPTEEITPEEWDVPEPETFNNQHKNLERATEVPDPHTMMNDGWFFEFPDNS